MNYHSPHDQMTDLDLQDIAYELVVDFDKQPENWTCHAVKSHGPEWVELTAQAHNKSISVWRRWKDLPPFMAEVLR